MTLRLGVVGAGVIGRAHAQRIAAQGGCTLAGLADPSPAAQALADELRTPLFDSLGALLAQARPDGVVLATPNALHVSGALQCLAAGVPVLVEKPVADSVADAQRLVDAAQGCGVPVLVGHHRRHSATMAAARAHIAGGRLGRLVAVSASATFAKPDSYFEQGPWRARAGGGPILINLVHEMDNLRALMGEMTMVHAFSSNAVRGHEVEDTAAINLRFASGALGTLLLSDCAASPRSWEQTSGENTAYDHHADQDCYVVCGTQGSLQVPTMRAYRYEGERSWFAPLACSRETLTPDDPLLRQLQHFCDVIRRQAEPLVNPESALRSLRATLAVAQSAATGRQVSLA